MSDENCKHEHPLRQTPNGDGIEYSCADCGVVIEPMETVTAEVVYVSPAHMVELRDRIDELTAELREAMLELAALEWKRITPECLPRVGDEIYCLDRTQERPHVIIVTPLMGKRMRDDSGYEWIIGNHWTHFRAINPPQEHADGKH